MQQRLSDITLGDIGRALSRYRPFVAAVVAIVLVVVFLPGKPKSTSGIDTASSVTSATGTTTSEAAGVTAAAPGSTDYATQSGSAVSTGAGPAAAAGAPAAVAAKAPGTATIQQGITYPRGCDTASGRLKFPSVSAPSCVPLFSGDNGGNTYQGVTKDTITVAVYRGVEDPATATALKAAGANDSKEDTEATLRAYTDLMQAHVEMYGRKIKLVYVEGSGKAEDDAAGKSDAIKVATEVKAFASWGAPNNTYVDELVARKVLCICTTSQPAEFYAQRDPYVGYTPLMASTQGYVHRAEYIGKRLAGRNAKFAGDPLYTTQKRTFGIIYYETKDNAYKTGVDFFERELAKYNVKLQDRISYIYDLAQAQEQARTVIGRMKDKNITSLVFSGDPLYPIFFTQEATRQNYKPEWIITGSALTDTSFFARTYDKTQWAQAFGVSYLAARAPQEVGEAYRVYMWHFGKTPQAKAGYGVIYPTPFIFMTGIHMAGPKLTPSSFRDGLFKLPPSSGAYSGQVTTAGFSFGDHGIFPSLKEKDFTWYDDATEIWWDNTASGKDEIGNDGAGLYRYVQMGKRYLPGQWPTTEPAAFDTANTVTIYPSLPASDKYPEYKNEPYK